MIAEMAVRLEQSRLLIYKAAALKDAGRSITKEAAMAKLSASETATFVAHQAIQVSVFTAEGLLAYLITYYIIPLALPFWLLTDLVYFRY